MFLRSSLTDPIVQLLGLLRPHSPHPCRQLIGYGDWAIAFPSEQKRAVFGIVTQGTCWLDYPDIESTHLHAGDFILLRYPPAWSLRSGKPAKAWDFRSTYDAAASPVVSFGDPRQGNDTRIIGGFFEFDPTNAVFLAQLIPPIIIVPSGEERAWRLRAVLDLINDEVATDREGRLLVFARLLDLLLLESLRLRSSEVAATMPGLLAGPSPAFGGCSRYSCEPTGGLAC